MCLPYLCLLGAGFLSFTIQPAAQPSQAKTLLTFFIQPISESEQSEQEDQSTKFMHTLAKPARVSRLILKNRLQHVPYRGIYATYAGLVTHSDQNGQITFPRKTLRDDLMLVITSRLQPLVLHGTTVQQLLLREGFPAALYHLERLKNQNDGVYYWHITRLPTPANYAIPDQAVILLADPDHIVVPADDIVTIPGTTLFLPTLYAIKDMDAAVTALSFLKISRYFSLVKTSYQESNDRYASLIMSS
jgi:hypothetical protein